MICKRCYLLVGLLGVLLLLGLASATSVLSSPPRAPDPSPGDFVRSPPAYDSGWETIDPGETLLLRHHLGWLNINDYVVNLMFSNGNTAHHLSYGSDVIGSDRNGAFWHNLTGSSVRVTRGAGDSEIAQVRLRIWVASEANYDSGWMRPFPRELITLTHSLGGNTDDYLVYMEAMDIPTDGPGLGVNHLYYGTEMSFGGSYWCWFGFHWGVLTANEITVYRPNRDWAADYVRVRIWRVPPSQYDSGWVSVGRGSSIALDHGLGGPNDQLFVDLQFKDDNEYAINQGCYGLTTLPSSYTLGATWYDLSVGSIRVKRGVSDSYADEVRLRIWTPPYKHWLPLGLGHY